ncbi:hypothetical protein DIPPA_17454 [Diplonema papillatum]|nr:hypothetical protein DIPPA_17454 [Diplonema papillatum]
MSHDYTGAPSLGATDSVIHLDLESCSTREIRQAIGRISRTLEARLDAYERNNHKLVGIIRNWEDEASSQLYGGG